MELLTYWKIIWRRLWLIVLIVGVVALYVGYEYYHLHKTPGALTAYSSNVTIQVGLQPINPQVLSSADMVTVSESLADALATGPILSSSTFDTQVNQQIQADMGQITQKYGANSNLGGINAGAIGGALSAQRAHALVTITTNWNTAPGAWAISNAVGEVLSTNVCTYLNYDIPQGSSCSATNNAGQPLVTAKLVSAASDPAQIPGPSASKLTLYIIMLLVAFIVAIALAFLLDYFDDRIRSKDDAAQLLQLPVYGTVPRPPTPGNTKTRGRDSLSPSDSSSSASTKNEHLPV
jgi:capsular polysaccharide biosynthesis protein